MERKAFPIGELKAVNGSDEPGTFEAIVAVFGNVDRGKDRVERGAFKRSLAERGMPPVVWSHNWDIPPIGVVTEAVENNEGLRIKGRLFVGEGEDHPVARQVYTAMKSSGGDGKSPLREFSFGYEVRDSEVKTEDGEEIRVLKDVDLFEVGPTLMGMNPATRLVGIKSEDPITAAIASKTLDECRAILGLPPLPLLKLSTDSPAVPDKPEPKSQQDEEAEARIRALLLSRPFHKEEQSS